MSTISSRDYRVVLGVPEGEDDEQRYWQLSGLGARYWPSRVVPVAEAAALAADLYGGRVLSVSDYLRAAGVDLRHPDDRHRMTASEWVARQLDEQADAEAAAAEEESEEDEQAA